MNQMKKIGLFGFGTVGKGFYQVLQRVQLPVEIAKVCVKRLDLERINHPLYFPPAHPAVSEAPACASRCE